MGSSVANEKTRTVTIEVHNEDTGKKPIKLEGKSTDLVQSFITKLYEALCLAASIRTIPAEQDRTKECCTASWRQRIWLTYKNMHGLAPALAS